jgi:MOSC domain-containing protein YiiM
MSIVSVNVGSARLLEGRSFNGKTGIFKRPIAEPITIGPLGLQGDAVLNEKHHGGSDQAVYLYRQEDYDWWSSELGRTIEPGTFGENLTLAGLPDPGLLIGSRLSFPAVTLEVTAPRIPCNTLAQRMDDPGFAKQFIRAERPGSYCRVIESGPVTVGEAFQLSPPLDGTVTTLDMFRGKYQKLSSEQLQRFLNAPIDIRSRTDYEAQLAKLAGTGASK